MNLLRVTTQNISYADDTVLTADNHNMQKLFDIWVEEM